MILVGVSVFVCLMSAIVNVDLWREHKILSIILMISVLVGAFLWLVRGY